VKKKMREAVSYIAVVIASPTISCFLHHIIKATSKFNKIFFVNGRGLKK